jgi:hypothetical protein
VSGPHDASVPVSLLERAVVRIDHQHGGARTRALSGAEGGPEYRQRRFAGDAPTGDRTKVRNSTPDAPAAVGFAGLAARTRVGAAPGQRHDLRLERESQPPADASLDQLDVTMAESLARILEREARRHGIDLAESRA